MNVSVLWEVGRHDLLIISPQQLLRVSCKSWLLVSRNCIIEDQAGEPFFEIRIYKAAGFVCRRSSPKNS